MAHYKLPLTAGQPARQIFSGKCVLLPDLGAADTVALTLLVGANQTPSSIGDAQRNFVSYSPSTTFTGAEFLSAVDTTIDIVVTDFELRTMNGNAVTAAIDVTQLPLPVQTVGAVWTDRSGTITAVGVSQQLMAANAARRGLWIQNLSAVDALWMREGAAASQGQPSLKIAPGAIYETPAGGCPMSSINLTGPTAGQAFSAREW